MTAGLVKQTQGSCKLRLLLLDLTFESVQFLFLLDNGISEEFSLLECIKEFIPVAFPSCAIGSDAVEDVLRGKHGDVVFRLPCFEVVFCLCLFRAGIL